ncbi:hypothetical protein [Enterobacter hormaechei]|uniref:hypothetical protein n=1 Tax=Enterobacter hormaechei TaxID=158836 RepID=UPI000F880335|nr:hypothetical protein [Enterobacter hormaechei]RTO96217.1 hypothetical protein EKN57_22200 [Enterobacter hormaechei]
MTRPLLINGMYGLGDNIYQRAFVRHLPGSWLVTPWPEVYQGLDVHFVRSDTQLRTQRKNEHNTDVGYEQPPEGAHTLRIGYGASALAQGSIITAMRRQFGITHPRFDLPDYGKTPVLTDRPIALVRPVTARREWLNQARNPEPDYIAQAARILRRHFFVVSVADLADGEEWLVGEPPEADLRLHHGELDITGLLSLTQQAAVAVGGVGWVVPAAISYGTPLYVVQGGCGAHNAPHVITDPAMNLRRVGWARPDNYCMCNKMVHGCSKRISNFEQNFTRWLHENVL